MTVTLSLCTASGWYTQCLRMPGHVVQATPQERANYLMRMFGPCRALVWELA